jgi:hypothetical protein
LPGTRGRNEPESLDNLDVGFAIPRIHNTRCRDRQKMFADYGDHNTNHARIYKGQHETEKEYIETWRGRSTP